MTDSKDLKENYIGINKVAELKGLKGFEMIEVERQNGINNRQGTDRSNKIFKELLIANYNICS